MQRIPWILCVRAVGLLAAAEATLISMIEVSSRFNAASVSKLHSVAVPPLRPLRS
jgi:hypothetical protein